MNPTVDIARAHYNATGLTNRIREALLKVAPEDRTLTVTEIAPMDHFHTRGLLATSNLGTMAAIHRQTRVLDLGCGIGGPARFFAAMFGCHVTGVDLSETFIDAAIYLTKRCALQDEVSFQVGNAVDLPFEAGTFDLVIMQHVAMNIHDRAGLYAEVARVLAPGGRLATYDVLVKGGDVHYPNPWARNASASFLLTGADTQKALISAGLIPFEWRDDSELALEWFSTIGSGGPSAGPTLGVILGQDFPALTGNLGRNLREGRIGILSAIAERR